MAASEHNRRKEDIVCPFHEETENKVAAIDNKLERITNQVTDLRIFTAKMIGGLIVAQVVFVPLLMVVLKHLKVL